MSEKEIVQLAQLMAEPIKICHDNNIIHLDIKMENYLVLGKNPLKVVLIDFGFAIDASVTSLKEILGTDLYIAPEVEKVPM